MIYSRPSRIWLVPKIADIIYRSFYIFAYIKLIVVSEPRVYDEKYWKCVHLYVTYISVSIAQNMYCILYIYTYTHIYIYIYIFNVKKLLSWYVIEVIYTMYTYTMYHSAVIERIVVTALIFCFFFLVLHLFVLNFLNPRVYLLKFCFRHMTNIVRNSLEGEQCSKI